MILVVEAQQKEQGSGSPITMFSLKLNKVINLEVQIGCGDLWEGRIAYELVRRRLRRKPDFISTRKDTGRRAHQGNFSFRCQEYISNCVNKRGKNNKRKWDGGGSLVHQPEGPPGAACAGNEERQPPPPAQVWR